MIIFVMYEFWRFPVFHLVQCDGAPVCKTLHCLIFSISRAGISFICKQNGHYDRNITTPPPKKNQILSSSCEFESDLYL